MYSCSAILLHVQTHLCATDQMCLVHLCGVGAAAVFGIQLALGGVTIGKYAASHEATGVQLKSTLPNSTKGEVNPR